MKHEAEGHSLLLSYPSHPSFPDGTPKKAQLDFIPDVNFLSLHRNVYLVINISIYIHILLQES